MKRGHRVAEDVKMEAEMQSQPRNSRSRQKLEEVGRDPALEPSQRVWPCRPHEFGLLASRAVGEETVVVLSHLICGHW